MGDRCRFELERQLSQHPFVQAGQTASVTADSLMKCPTVRPRRAKCAQCSRQRWQRRWQSLRVADPGRCLCQFVPSLLYVHLPGASSSQGPFPVLYLLGWMLPSS